MTTADIDEIILAAICVAPFLIVAIGGAWIAMTKAEGSNNG